MNRRIALLFLVALVALSAAATAVATAPSANGKIAFRRYFNDDKTWGAVFTMSANGANQIQITHPVRGTFDDQPDWAPNGSAIAFTRCPRDPYACVIYTAAPDGGQLRRLSPCPPGGKVPAQCANDSTAQFSPDSKTLVFTESRGPTKKDPNEGDIVQHSSIAVMNIDGSGRHVAYRGAPYSSDLQYPVFSPDGKRIVFERDNSSFSKPAVGKALFVVNDDGTNAHRITPWTERDGDNPDWSPDGRWILYRTHQEDPAAQSQFAIVHPDGTGARVLTHFPSGTHVTSGSFSPDGTSITFGKGPEGGNIDVFTMSFDGSHITRLTRSPLWDSAPDWGPAS